MSISAANGRLKLEITSTFDRSTKVSYKCAVHITGLASINRNLYSYRMSITANRRFRPLGGA